MKKPVKITLISLASLLGVVVIALLVAIYMVLTPARLTSIVNNLAKDYVNCDVNFGEVELTVVKTFPYAGIEIHDVCLVNPTNFAPSDTVATINTCTVSLNVKDYLDNGSIVVKELEVDGVKARLAVAKDGHTNFDIITTEESPEEVSETESEIKLDLQQICLKNVTCSYDDEQSGLHAAFDNLEGTVHGTMHNSEVDGDLKLSVDRLACNMMGEDGRESIAALLEDVSLRLQGCGNLDNTLKGKVSLKTSAESIRMDGQDFINEHFDSKVVEIQVPFEYSGDELRLGETELGIGEFLMTLQGAIKMPENAGLVADIDFDASNWNVARLVSMLPYEYASWSEGMSFDATASANGRISYGSDSTYPSKIVADVAISKARWAYPEALPYTFNIPTAEMDLSLSLTDAPSSLDIRHFVARTGKNDISGSMRIDDLTDRFLLDANLSGTLVLHDALNLAYYPEPLPMKLGGKARFKNLKFKTNLAQLEEMAIGKMHVSGALDVDDLDVDYDSVMLDAKHLAMTLSIPAKNYTNSFAEMLSLNGIKGDLHMMMPELGVDARLGQSDVSLSVSDIMSEVIPLSVYMNFQAESVEGAFDAMPIMASSTKGVLEYVPMVEDPAKEHYRVDLTSRMVNVRIDDTTTVDIGTMSVNGTADYDSTRGNALKQWSPNFDIKVGRGMVQSSGLIYALQLPDFKMNYQPERCYVSESKVIYGRSEIDFSGTIDGLEDWISSEGMLQANLNLTSNYTNVDELMELFSGAGTDPDTLELMMKEDNVKAESMPFMVPKDVLLDLNLHVQEALAFDNELQELAGDVKIYDGVAVLNAVSFVCDAGKMQVTGLYQSPRPSKLYAGLDFHLIDLKIDELIKMIPMVDTLVPMLAYFDGDADFHMIVSTNLYPDYTPMIPKMRGAVAIKAKDLRVLDNETFDKIANLMRFKKSTENKFDSLDVELTLFKDEVELYPSMISMDKYSVCVSGSHLLDPKKEDNDYHLEIIESPLPMRLAVDVKGLSPFSIKLGKVQYANLYKPTKRNAAQQQSLELKHLISATLESKVKESTRKMKKSN